MRVQRGSVAAREGLSHAPVVHAHIACTPFLQVFGERGYHARSAIGTNTLPLGIAVEVEAIIKVRPL
eukprot:scaffold6420_cov53-Phaeocystis_antarctica.AAC.5